MVDLITLQRQSWNTFCRQDIDNWFLQVWWLPTNRLYNFIC